jgi:hypothetical protein
MQHIFWYAESEYESEYEGDYSGIYDQNFVFYDEDELEEADSDSSSEAENYDLILEEIPFVYCPSNGDVGEA